MNSKQAIPQTIDDYIAGCAEAVRPLLEKIRTTIRKAAHKAEEAISYQMPTFKLHGNLVHFMTHAKHIGFYPTPSGITAFQDELAKYASAKGSVQFPLDKPIPYALIGKIVKFRVKENLERPAAKTKKKPKSKL
ncbi:MAG: hypothetical protein HOP19_05615 [Acidobacteria bacterium]|nr:hypothetical protein [Acidobacteriota bacterium]